MSSVLRLGSGGRTRTISLQASNPAVYGSKRKAQMNSIRDFRSSQESAGSRNRSSSGYEPQCWGGGLMQTFHLFEGATRCSVSPSPTRLIRESSSKGTS
jgi:hypothetical protein